MVNYSLLVALQTNMKLGHYEPGTSFICTYEVKQMKNAKAKERRREGKAGGKKGCISPAQLWKQALGPFCIPPVLCYQE